MNLELVRYAYLDDCVLGILKTPEFRLPTIERPWFDNPVGPGGLIGESCVPDAKYVLEPHDGQRFPESYVLSNEACGVYKYSCPNQGWGRTAILIHAGNTVDDVEGCIAVGLTTGRLRGDRAVLRSRAAMERLRELLGRTERHRITIRPTRGTDEL